LVISLGAAFAFIPSIVLFTSTLVQRGGHLLIVLASRVPGQVGRFQHIHITTKDAFEAHPG